MGSPVKSIRNAALAAIVFCAVSLLFRGQMGILSVMGIRPSALPPALGLVLGVPGVLGCALGGLAAEIAMGHIPLVYGLGFVSRLIYGILPILLWNSFHELKKTPPRLIRLNNVKNVILYTAIVIISSGANTFFIGSVMYSLGITTRESFLVSIPMLFLTNFVFCIMIGIPLITFMSIIKVKKGVSLNERLVLIFLLSGAISGGLMGVSAYSGLPLPISDPAEAWMRVYLHIAVNLLLFYAITLVFLRYAELNITVPIESIARIAGNFMGDERIKKSSAVIARECEELIKNRSETGVLAEAFKKMVLDLDTYIDSLTVVMAENERISAELNIARQIQADMLPNNFPAFPERHEFEVYAAMQPAKEVGGDFYDFFLIDSNHLCVVIADVSGKGVPAALFMVISKTLIKNSARNGEEPGDVFTKVGTLLREGNENAMFVTAWMGVLEISTGKMVCVNAGHNPPLIRKHGGSFEFLRAHKNIMLAGVDGAKYKQSEFQLDSGDILYLYTDGVTEALNCEGEQYGEKRLLLALNNTNNTITPENILARIKSDVDVFAKGEPQSDDITMLALQVK